MIVNPGIRRFLGSAIQRLFNSASVSLPLTHTAVPTRGSITPTFTRATTETGQKWDEAGYLDFTALAGEIVFKGARRERNEWTTSSVTLASGNNKSLTLAAGTYQFSMGAGTGTATFSGTGGATGTLGASASARVSVTKTITAGTLVITASVADLADLQVCNITGETDQTTIRPYVSVGVASAPAYHGSMVDGVKCYSTDRSGNPISTSGSYPLVGYVPWEARTNLVLRSAELDNASWTKNNCTVSADVAIASDGTTTLDKIVEAATATTHTVYQTFSGTSGSYTVSVEMKKAERSWGFITEGNSVTATAYFNLDTGVVGTVTGTGAPSATITALANGAYRCTMTFTSGANANCQFGPASDNGVANYLGDITKGVYAGRINFESGSFATPYIPTTTVAVARNADVLTYTGAEIANYKSLRCQFMRGTGVSNVGAVVSLNDGTVNNYANIALANATDLSISGVSGGAAQWAIAATYTPAVQAKSAFSEATNDIKADFSGTALTPDSSATTPAVTALHVGHFEGGSVLNGPVGQIYAWNRNLSQSELGAIDRA